MRVGGKAPTVAEFAALFPGLPQDRAEALQFAHKLVNDTLPAGYEETVQGKMIVWSIPLDRYPHTYNKQPLQFVALAAQKNYNALYFTALYVSAERTRAFVQSYAEAGKKLDMGKGCVRFRTVDDLCETAVRNAVASVPVEDYIRDYEAARNG